MAASGSQPNRRSGIILTFSHAAGRSATMQMPWQAWCRMMQPVWNVGDQEGQARNWYAVFGASEMEMPAASFEPSVLISVPSGMVRA